MVLARFIDRDIEPQPTTDLVRVSITVVRFEEKTSADDSFLLPSFGDPYYVITVDGQRHVTGPTFEGGARILGGYFPIVFEIPADRQFVIIEIQAWDSDFDLPDPLFDERYDISTTPGSDSTGLSILTVFDVMGGPATITGDGTLDGSDQGPQAAITVMIEAR